MYCSIFSKVFHSPGCATSVGSRMGEGIDLRRRMSRVDPGVTSAVYDRCCRSASVATSLVLLCILSSGCVRSRFTDEDERAREGRREVEEEDEIDAPPRARVPSRSLRRGGMSAAMVGRVDRMGREGRKEAEEAVDSSVDDLELRLSIVVIVESGQKADKACRVEVEGEGIDQSGVRARGSSLRVDSIMSVSQRCRVDPE